MSKACLVKPSATELPAYLAALERGWSPDNVRKDKTAKEHLRAAAADADAFLSSLDDPDAKGPPIPLPDGSSVPRLPGFVRWVWDGDYCGSIGFRWQPGTPALPAHVLGHIGFAIVPWKQGLGYAKQALRLLLPRARDQGLPYVELTTDPENLASQKVILACGGEPVGRFQKAAVYGASEALKFRVDLATMAGQPGTWPAA